MLMVAAIKNGEGKDREDPAGDAAPLRAEEILKVLAEGRRLLYHERYRRDTVKSIAGSVFPAGIKM